MFELLSEPALCDALSSLDSKVEADDSSSVACDVVNEDESGAVCFDLVVVAGVEFN